ncbi:phospholipase domain-containing protein [Brevundimonas aurantiaca]|uniref:phospholipase domain-containing protein n=1 Tax=Brevundimonas aurantiaca TaxID=74316 RepID=UPI0037BE6D4B
MRSGGFGRSSTGPTPDPVGGRFKAASASVRVRTPRRGRGLILEIVLGEDAWFCVSDEAGLYPTRRHRVSAGAPLRLRLPVRADGGYDLTVSRLGGDFRRRFSGRLASKDQVRSCG